MPPQPRKASAKASKDKAGPANTNDGLEANAHLSNPVPLANQFVAFNAGGSKEDRRAVRVQAAKASAAARKATIARKQAKQKQGLAEPADVQPLASTATESPSSAQAYPTGGKGKRRKTSPQPGDWRLQTGRFRGTGHAVAGARETKASNAEQEVVRAAVKPWTAPTTSWFGQLTPGESQTALTTLPPQYWQQPQHVHPLGGSLSEFEFWPPPLEQAGKPPDGPTASGADSELPMTPVSMASLPSPSRVGLAYADPFNCYPVPYRPIYDSLLHHMLTVFAPRGWPALRITRQEGLDWEHFMTQHALAEPSLFFVRLLFASGDMIRLGVLNPEISLWLQSEAIKTINEALARPDRATSDGVILAVGRIALHESMYGDRTAANIMHRPAQRRMIDLRGGMRALDFPLLVKRLMRWADRVMSVQGGTDRFLPDDEDQGNQSFTTAQSVDVLERWVPREGQALRKKIAISDLLSD